MKNIKPINQTKLFGLDKYFNELMTLDKKNILPNKIMLSGPKGQGKSTLSYHFINYILSKEEEFKYDVFKFEINSKNRTFKTILNRSNPNLILINVSDDKKNIDINQIRELIFNLKKSSFNNKPRFVLIDNIELLNVNSINALLKILEEPSSNIYFILINNNKKVLPTLLSRCLNFKIFLSNNENLIIAEKLLECNLLNTINKDLLNYYLSAGNIYSLVKFANENNYDLINLNLKNFLKKIISNNDYKKDSPIKYLIYDFLEFYFYKINSSISSKIYDNYTYFIKKISDTKKFNLDEESLFIEFEDKILNG